MRISLSSPSIAPHVRQTVKAYYEAQYLETFYTGFLDHPDQWLSNTLKRIGPLKKEIQRRSFDDVPFELIETRPFPELLRSFSARKLSPLITDKIWEWSELGFDQWVSEKINLSGIDAVHTYEHAALATLKRAKDLKIFSIYEQPSQHHSFFSSIAKKQFELHPELVNDVSELLVNEKAQRRNQRRDEELRLASLVLCNSSFTKKTLIAGGVDGQKISVVPLAFPNVSGSKRSQECNKPMIFLYAGNQSIRKASHLLYQAWHKCNFSESQAELWLIGKMQLPENLRTDLPGKVIIRENIPHNELMDIFKKANVFVMPTLADGFGMVVTEAMSQGLPVIASENSCGPDVIEHMKDGWLIPAGNVDLLVSQMKWCTSNPEKVVAFGNAAKEKAEKYQWLHYRKNLTDLIFDKWQKFNQEKKSV